MTCYFGAKIIRSSFTWNDSTPLFYGSSFLIGSDTDLYYLINVWIINNVSDYVLELAIFYTSEIFWRNQRSGIAYGGHTQKHSHWVTVITCYLSFYKVQTTKVLKLYYYIIKHDPNSSILAS